MSTGYAAIPLLKAAPEPDQIADRLEGGPWRGLELCLMPQHVADDAALARAIDGEPIVIPGDPGRTRDFLYVDDLVPALAKIAAERRWNQTLTLGSSVNTPLIEAARLVVETLGSDSPIETPGGDLAPGENESYDTGAGLNFDVRPLDSAVGSYVDWLRRHPAAQGRTRA